MFGNKRLLFTAQCIQIISSTTTTTTVDILDIVLI